MIYRILLLTFFIATGRAQILQPPTAEQDDSEPPVIFVAQVAHGAGLQTTFNFVDLSGETNRVAVRAFDDTGEPLELLSSGPSPFQGQTAETEIGVEISGLGGTVAETFSSDPDSIQVGYVEITAEAPVGVEVVFRNFSSEGRLLTTTSVLPEPLTQAFSFIAFANSFAKSGIALLNPASNGQSVDVSVQLYNRFGDLAAESVIELDQGQKVAILIDDPRLFPELLGQEFTGSIEIRATAPLGVTIIRVEGSEAFLTTQTVQPARGLE
ncbi:MAG: hypothetical protein ACRD1R_12895 [Acidobacteriota bacterium]